MMHFADRGLLGAKHRQAHAHARRLLLGALLAADSVALVVALISAGVLRSHIDTVLPVTALGWVDRHVVASILAIPVLLVLFWVSGHYDIDECLVGTRDYANTAHGVTYGLIMALALSYFSGDAPLVSRSWLLLVWGTSILCVSLERFVARRIVRRIRRGGRLHTRVVIVGASTFGVAIADQLLRSTDEGIQVVGFLDEYLPLGQALLPGVTVIGRPHEIATRLRVDPVDEFILVPQALPHERLEEITRLMVFRDGPVVRIAISSRDLLTHGLRVTTRAHVPLVMLQPARISGIDRVLKRVLDVVGALIVLVCVSPLVGAAVARAWRPGQRLYVPELVHAPGGRTARLWLLDRAVSRRLAIRGAPALLSVVSGQLSLVGPRPRRWDSGDDLQTGMSLIAVPPGLTGPWRLSGPSASLDEQMLEDLAYVRNYSIWEDLRILWDSVRPGTLLGRWQAQASLFVAGQPDAAAVDVALGIGEPVAAVANGLAPSVGMD